MITPKQIKKMYLNKYPKFNLEDKALFENAFSKELKKINLNASNIAELHIRPD